MGEGLAPGENGNAGPLSHALGAGVGVVLGRPLSALYGLGVRWRSRRFDAWHGVRLFDVPVISVGNLSVGGTGKTPMVREIVRWLVAEGKHPAVAMRGYASTSADRLQGSDEAREYAATLPRWSDGRETPIVARPDRAAGLDALFSTEAGKLVDRVVLDDGFQHRRLARDLDIVLVDATRDPWSDRLLPAGWLREPVSALERAHAVVITHAESVDPERIERLTWEADRAMRHGQVVVARHRWSGLRVGDAVREVEWLRGKRVFAVCAIGNPGPFLKGAAASAGGELAGRMVLQDHDPYSARTVGEVVKQAAAAKADVILTTEKDWTKLAHVEPSRWGMEVARPVLEIVFDSGGEALRSLVTRVRPEYDLARER